MKNYLTKLAVPTIVVAAVTTFSSVASAFTITSTLTGDPRTGNPNGLEVDVTIQLDASDSTKTLWTVDLSPMFGTHNSATLDEFNFNLGTAADTNNDGFVNLDDITFSAFSPATWSVSAPGDGTGAGTGTNAFAFEADGANPTDVGVDTTSNNIDSQTLVFTAQLANNMSWTEAMFSGAPNTVTDAGTANMGVHLKSLTVASGSNESDSGFAMGDYSSPASVPEPSSIALLALGLIGVGLGRRRLARK